MDIVWPILRDALRAPQDEVWPVSFRRQPLRKILDIDETAGVAAVADLARALEGFDLEANDAAFHRDDLCRGPHRGADQRRAEMTDIDLGADGDPARFKQAADRVARG